MLPTKRRRGDGRQLKHRQFYLNIRNFFFSVRVTKQWNRFSREAVEPLSLEIFKMCLDTVPSNLL